MVMTMISCANDLPFKKILLELPQCLLPVALVCRCFFGIGGGRGKKNYSKTVNEILSKVKDSEELARL